MVVPHPDIVRLAARRLQAHNTSHRSEGARSALGSSMAMAEKPSMAGLIVVAVRATSIEGRSQPPAWLVRDADLPET